MSGIDRDWDLRGSRARSPCSLDRVRRDDYDKQVLHVLVIYCHEFAAVTLEGVTVVRVVSKVNFFFFFGGGRGEVKLCPILMRVGISIAICSYNFHDTCGCSHLNVNTVQNYFYILIHFVLPGDRVFLQKF